MKLSCRLSRFYYSFNALHATHHFSCERRRRWKVENLISWIISSWAEATHSNVIRREFERNCQLAFRSKGHLTSAISIVSSNPMAARAVWATHLCCVWTSFEWNAVYVFAINSIASIRFFVLFSANRRRWAPDTNRNLHFVIFAECEISKDLIGIWRSSLNENQDGENFRHRLHTNCLRCCAPSASQAIINEWMNEWTRGDAEGSRRDESIWY